MLKWPNGYLSLASSVIWVHDHAAYFRGAIQSLTQGLLVRTVFGQQSFFKGGQAPEQILLEWRKVPYRRHANWSGR